MFYLEAPLSTSSHRPIFPPSAVFQTVPSFGKTSSTGLQSAKHVVCVDPISICATTNEYCVANKQAAIWSMMAAL